MSRENLIRIYTKMLINGDVFDEDKMPSFDDRMKIARRICEEYADEVFIFSDFLSEEDFKV